jgi:hypothetical protein
MKRTNEQRRKERKKDRNEGRTTIRPSLLVPHLSISIVIRPEASEKDAVNVTTSQIVYTFALAITYNESQAIHAFAHSHVWCACKLNFVDAFIYLLRKIRSRKKK